MFAHRPHFQWFFFAAILALCAGWARAQQSASNPPPQGGEIPRQEQNQTPKEAAPPERWNLFYQATSIGQYHGAFHAPYSGPFSLVNHSERDVSLTTTLFFGMRLEKNTQLYFDPEIAGGRGFSGVSGLANSSNGELPRVASATPKPYVARLYISHDFGFGAEKEAFESEENQLAGERPMTRYTITAGRFTVTDFFDNNRYSHDPRTQFMGWGIMYNGAWDYPADVRGYTWGWVHEFHTKSWSLRYGSGAMPRVANGLRFDRRLFRNRGDVFEGEYRYALKKRPGTVRLLGYVNRAKAGTYAEAIRDAGLNGGKPDLRDTRRNGTRKGGFGFNFEQEIFDHAGIFGRLGWNDGKTEAFAFTAIDRLASIGFSIAGPAWKRPYDTAGTELTVSGLAGVHATFLARGGNDFLIGDGRLRYGTENIWETYYSARLFPGFFASYDLQHVSNPAYNRDRGPVWISSLRLHMEFGKQSFSPHPKK